MLRNAGRDPSALGTVLMSQGTRASASDVFGGDADARVRLNWSLDFSHRVCAGER